MNTIIINCCFISPYRGSEWAVAWNHVTKMSKYFKIIVLYGASGGYIGDNTEMVHWQESNFISNVEFIYVEPPLLTKFGENLNKKGFIYAHFPAFRLWQKRAYKIAKDIITTRKIDLIHHLGPIGYREPGYLWKLNLPYVCGAIGGFEEPDPKLLGILNLKNNK